jgi:hypothetical protein
MKAHLENLLLPDSCQVRAVPLRRRARAPRLTWAFFALVGTRHVCARGGVWVEESSQYWQMCGTWGPIWIEILRHQKHGIDRCNGITGCCGMRGCQTRMRHRLDDGCTAGWCSAFILSNHLVSAQISVIRAKFGLEGLCSSN